MIIIDPDEKMIRKKKGDVNQGLGHTISTKGVDRMKMFITDLDGTLFRSDHSFSKNDLDMLEKLGSLGVIRVLATGRSLFSLKRSIPFHLPVDYLIFSTGLGVASYPDPHKHTLKTETLSHEDTKTIASLLENLGVDYMIQDPVPDNHAFAFRHFGRENSDFNTRLDFYKGHYRAISPNIMDLGPSSQFLAMIPGGNGKETLDCLRRTLHAYTVINSSSPFDGKTMWIEIFPKSVSKSKAATWLSNQLKIDRNDIVAVGNDYNDEDLLEWVGQAFVVANSPPDMKKRFSVVASNNHEGVCEAIQAML